MRTQTSQINGVDDGSRQICTCRTQAAKDAWSSLLPVPRRARIVEEVSLKPQETFATPGSGATHFYHKSDPPPSFYVLGC